MSKSSLNKTNNIIQAGTRSWRPSSEVVSSFGNSQPFFWNLLKIFISLVLLGSSDSIALKLYSRGQDRRCILCSSTVSSRFSKKSCRHQVLYDFCLATEPILRRSVRSSLRLNGSLMVFSVLTTAYMHWPTSLTRTHRVAVTMLIYRRAL